MLLTGNKMRKLWFGVCPDHSFLVLLLVFVMGVGCERHEKAGCEYAESVVVSVKSADGQAPVNSAQVWAFKCDAQGNVSNTANVGYAYGDGESSLSIDLDGDSRYCLILAGANMPAGVFGESSSLARLRSSKFSGMLDGETATHWTVVDLASSANGIAEVPMEVFPTCARICMNVWKASEAMTLLIDEIALLSSNAPTQGVFFSAMSGDQIKAGGLYSDNWYFNGLTLECAPCSKVLVSETYVSGSQSFSPLFTAYVHENQAGWTDLSDYRESGWRLNPADADPGCTGHYLSISYRYALSPETSVDSEQAVSVLKYIPLAPLCRGNEYRFDIKFNLDEIVVYGSTEVSEEVEGEW